MQGTQWSLFIEQQEWGPRGACPRSHPHPRLCVLDSALSASPPEPFDGGIASFGRPSRAVEQYAERGGKPGFEAGKRRPSEDGGCLPWRGGDRTNHWEVSLPQFACSPLAKDEALLSAKEFSQPVSVAYHTVAGPG